MNRAEEVPLTRESAALHMGTSGEWRYAQANACDYKNFIG